MRSLSDVQVFVQSKSISLLRACMSILAYLLLFTGCGMVIVFFIYGGFPAGFVDRIALIFGVFIPVSLLLAWFIVWKRKIQMKVVWVADGSGVSRIKDGLELSRIEWRDVAGIRYRKNRLVLVTRPRSPIWALSGVVREDADQVRAFFEFGQPTPGNIHE